MSTEHDYQRLSMLLYQELERDPWVPDDANFRQRLYRACASAMELWRLERTVARRIGEQRCSRWSPDIARGWLKAFPDRAGQERVALLQAKTILRRFKHPAFPTWEQAGLPANQKPTLVRGRS